MEPAKNKFSVIFRGESEHADNYLKNAMKTFLDNYDILLDGPANSIIVDKHYHWVRMMPGAVNSKIYIIAANRSLKNILELAGDNSIDIRIDNIAYRINFSKLD